MTLVAILATSTAALAEGGQPGAHFIENWDMNGDGAVTLADIEEKRGFVFASFDGNEDGLLDAEEYALFDEARKLDMENNGGHGGGMNRVQEGMSLPFNDVDGDGAVSQDEFLGQSQAWLEMIDKNGDGSITSADFGKGN